MAAPVITLQNERVDNGVRTVTVLIVQDATTTTTTETSIDIPDYITLKLVEANLLGSGTAVSIQPAFGTVTGWTVGSDGSVDQASAAAATVRIADDKRVAARTKKLFILSKPNVNLDSTLSIETRITYAYGV